MADIGEPGYVYYHWDSEAGREFEKKVDEIADTRIRTAVRKLDVLFDALAICGINHSEIHLRPVEAANFYRLLCDAGVEHAIIRTRRFGFFGSMTARFQWRGVWFVWDFENLVWALRDQRGAM